MILEEFKKIDRNEHIAWSKKYKDCDPTKLALELSKQKEIPGRIISEQIACLKKAEKKLPLLNKFNLLYDKVALEQCSGESAAKAKAELIEGSTIIDLTGGLGIDDIYFAKKFDKVIYCELNDVLSRIVEGNLKELNINNIKVKNRDSIEYLKSCDDKSFDWIYIDPARREGSQRSVDLEYCIPNVYDNLGLFFRKSNNVLIKAAPAFDIHEAVNRFSDLTDIIVISVDNECKEVLLKLKEDKLDKRVLVRTIILNSKISSEKVFKKYIDDKIVKEYSEIKEYFYEPDVGLIKSGLSSVAAEEFGFSFINNKCDFLTGEKLNPNFSGRSFKVVNTIQFKDKIIKSYLKENHISKANVSKRAFRLSVADIRKRLKLKEGGSDFLFFTIDLDGNQLMIHAVK